MKTFVALKGMYVKLSIIAATGILVTLQPIRPLIFVGESMAPTYQNHQIVLTSVRVGEVKRGDVVGLASPDGRIVKRVAYVAGDSVPQIHVDHEWMDIPCLGVSAKTEKKLKGSFRYAAVPQGYIYVLGDNQAHSLDSRYYGCFPVTAIERVVIDPIPFETPAPGRHRGKPLLARLD